VVVRPTLEAACTDVPTAQDPYEAVLERSRCEHPDMLVHPEWYVVRPVAAPPNLARFAVEDVHAGFVIGRYEVLKGQGTIRAASGP
jgi:hypothetical protein